MHEAYETTADGPLPARHSGRPNGFAAYERLRRPRVEKIAARAARTNRNKQAGPVADLLLRLAMPLMMKTFGLKAFTADQKFRIDWDERVS